MIETPEKRAALAFYPEASFAHVLENTIGVKAFIFGVTDIPRNHTHDKEDGVLSYGHREEIIAKIVAHTLPTVLRETESGLSIVLVPNSPPQEDVLEQYGIWADDRAGRITPTNPLEIAINVTPELEEAYRTVNDTLAVRVMGLRETHI